MNPSVVVTIKNEADSIVKLLDSLSQQTLTPSEIILVDAGSTDSTISIIKKWHHNHSNIILQVLTSANINRSQGRNLGILKSKSPIIAVTDAGCVAKPDWLKLITHPIQIKKSQAVAGFYQTLAHTPFQKCIAPFVAVSKENFNPQTFLPSSRSIAFLKSAWLKAGKYPENLEYCEDLIFARNLKKVIKFAIVPNALVVWSLPSNLKDYFKQIRNYSMGDLQAGYKPHIFKLISVLLRYAAFLIFPPLILVYFIITLVKFRSYIINVQSIVYILLIRLVTDLAISISVAQFSFFYINPIKLHDHR